MLAEMKIVSVEMRIIEDVDSDTSYIGEYTNEKSEWAIHRASGEYVHDLQAEFTADALREWKADKESCGYKVEFNTIDGIWDALDDDGDWVDSFESPEWEPDYIDRREYNYFVPYAGGETPGTEEYKKYGLQDFERMESMSRGEWNFIGIRAVAKLQTPAGTQEIESGGMWGTESDSGEDYFKEVYAEECSELRQQLEKMGFSDSELEEHFPAQSAV